MKETSKANERRKNDILFKKIFKGHGIDIGCGEDLFKKDLFPDVQSCEPFDLFHGDANFINKLKQPETFDFVYSSNCLEHLEYPFTAIEQWFSLVKDKGHLVIVIPDEDLYEQGIWPSKWNRQHKWSFTIYKRQSWCKQSINVFDLIKTLNNCKVVRIELVDTNYDYKHIGLDQTYYKEGVETFIEIVLQKEKEPFWANWRDSEYKFF